MASLIYTHQKSKLSKKKREAQEQLRKEQRAIRRSLRGESVSHRLPTQSSPYRRETEQIASVGAGVGVATARPTQTYTGDQMIGIGQLHKSNAVPVFRQEDAQDIARMRR